MTIIQRKNRYRCTYIKLVKSDQLKQLEIIWHGEK